MAKVAVRPGQGAAATVAGGRSRPAGLHRLAGNAAMLVPGAAALAVDGYRLGALSLWRDEAYTLDAAHRTVPQIFRLLAHTDAVNGAYYLLVHGLIAVAGTSVLVLRLPALVAMAAAAVMTSLTGRRLATVAALPAPPLTGMLAGLLLVAAPQATRYAQEARSYGIVVLLATVATYLLLRAMDGGRRRWWAAYGLAVAVMGTFNVLALVLVAAHAVTMLAVRARRRGHVAGASRAPLRPWLLALLAAGITVAPVAVLGFRQRHQISWLHPPGAGSLTSLADSFSGSKTALPLVALIVLVAVAAGAAAGWAAPGATAGWAASGAAVGAAPGLLTVGVPWLVLPPAVLLLVSQVRPVYDERYVMFCLPALALLQAGGLARLAQLTTAVPVRWIRGPIAWLPSILVLAALGLLLAGPQRGVREPSSRPDNLRAASAIVAAHERPADAVMYLPANRRVFGMGYPGPFSRLWDVALARSPVSAGNLIGTDVSTRVLRQRFAGVTRVWLVTERGRGALRAARGALQRAELGLLRHWHVLGRWHAGDVGLTLLGRADAPWQRRRRARAGRTA